MNRLSVIGWLLTHELHYFFFGMTPAATIGHTRPNKTDPGSGSKAICRAIDASSRRRLIRVARLNMKCLLTAVFAHLALTTSAVAGRPIILDEVEACAQTDLVVIATISAAKDVPTQDPFDGPSGHPFGFAQFAQAEVEQTLFGIPPDELWIYGGKLLAGTDFRLEEGRYLVLLTKVKDGAYRAVDWHYSFAPLKDGKVGWLLERFPAKREWISSAEVLGRIKANKAKSEK